MTHLSRILTICTLGMLGACQHVDDPGEQEWQDQLYQNLAVVGARNWVVIAESSYPAYTGQGIKTIVSNKQSDEVLLDVLNILEEEAHVVPRIMLNTELRSVTDDYAPGIKKYRKKVNALLPGRQHFELMSRTLNSLIEDAAKQFNVLVIKTRTALPYSNIYIELDSGYWNSESETALRRALKEKEAANNQQLKPDNRALDVPLNVPQNTTQGTPHNTLQPQNPGTQTPTQTMPHPTPVHPQGASSTDDESANYIPVV